MHRAKVKFAGSEQLREIRIDFSSEKSVEYNGSEYNKKQVSFQSPVSGTIYGTLLNYRGQLEAMKKEFHEAPYKEPPKKPILYMKPVNTINSHLKPIPLPAGEPAIQVGAALGVVIGKNATKVTIDQAFDYVEGYTVVNDVSIPHESFYRPDIKNKVRDGFCPVGPWIIERSAVSNPDELDIRVSVNGEVVQENNTKNLVRSVAQLIAEVTEFMTLSKGDVLLVGVPENAPHVKAGDTVRIDIPGVGSLENTVVAEDKINAGGDV